MIVWQSITEEPENPEKSTAPMPKSDMSRQNFKSTIMKKLLFLTVVFAGCYFAGRAQNSRLGFTGGASFANYKAKMDGESDNGNSKTGITAGLLVDVPLGDHFSFQPALNFVQKGTKDEQTLGGITEKVSLTTNHIEVPLNFLFNTNGDAGNFFIGAGPSFAFGVSGKWKYEDDQNSLSEDVKFGNSDEDDLKGMDLGANFIAGYSFPNGLFLSANYNLGLSNLVAADPGGDASLKSSYFGIRLGYLLKGKGKK